MTKKIIKKLETHPLTWRLRDDKKPIWIKEYQKKNGYIGAYKALNEMIDIDIISMINNSGLKGRGGAGFPTGLKWKLMTENINCKIKYLLCNADEMEPGAFKDRFLMEQLPHLLIEGMIIAAFALKTYRGYIFIRGEYINASIILQQAINEAYDSGFLGKNIFNSEFNFDIIIHSGAGRYICGEETALINSLEGRRAIPRSKPPFPSNIGLWGKPTCINNVETLCNLPAILTNGVIWYKDISSKKSNDSGTKLMGISGKVNNPGVWELPFGVTALELFEKYARGMNSGLSLKAWQPGGGGTSFLTKNHLDVPMDFENIKKHGSRLGTALVIAVDNKINMISLTRNLEEFFARESCGWCTPCREGLPWIVKLLSSLEINEGQKGDIEILEELCFNLSSGKTFCALAPGAIEPLQSAIKYFRHEFESGIKINIEKNKN